MAAIIRAILGCVLMGLLLSFGISNLGAYVMHSESVRTTGVGVAVMLFLTCLGMLVPVIVYTVRRHPSGWNSYTAGAVAAIVNVAWLACIYPSIAAWNPLAVSLGPQVGFWVMVVLFNLVAAALSFAALFGLDARYRRMPPGGRVPTASPSI